MKRVDKPLNPATLHHFPSIRVHLSLQDGLGTKRCCSVFLHNACCSFWLHVDDTVKDLGDSVIYHSTGKL